MAKCGMLIMYGEVECGCDYETKEDDVCLKLFHAKLFIKYKYE